MWFGLVWFARTEIGCLPVPLKPVQVVRAQASACLGFLDRGATASVRLVLLSYSEKETWPLVAQDWGSPGAQRGKKALDPVLGLGSQRQLGFLARATNRQHLGPYFDAENILPLPKSTPTKGPFPL